MEVNRLGRAAAVPWMHLRSAVLARRWRKAFRTVKTYCQFVGYPRSGHTLVYALLNAHPEVVLANELGLLQWMPWGFRRGQLLSMILRADRRFTAQGSRFQGYDYVVPNQWQGRFRSLTVIGDKDGGRDTTRLAKNPALLETLERRLGLPVRLIHVIRNPYDAVATVAKRRTQRGRTVSIEGILDEADRALQTVARVIEASESNHVVTIAHEDSIQRPRKVLAELCSHLGVEAGDDYLDDCASIVFPSARRTRSSVAWTPQLIDRVQNEMIGRYDFLARYSFEDD